jgi:hypothetical protein
MQKQRPLQHQPHEPAEASSPGQDSNRPTRASSLSPAPDGFGESLRKRTASDLLERPVIKSPRHGESAATAVQAGSSPDVASLPDLEDSTMAATQGFATPDVADTSMDKSLDDFSSIDNQLHNSSTSGASLPTLAARVLSSSSRADSSTSLAGAVLHSVTELSDDPSAVYVPTSSDLSAKAIGKLPQVATPPLMEQANVLEEVEAGGYALFVLAEDSIGAATLDRWISIAALGEAARDTIANRHTQAVNTKAAKEKYARLTGRGQKEVSSLSPACIECDCTHRNRRICTYTLGKTTPDTKQACDKCLDDKHPCGRLIDHPSGTGFTLGFVPVPEQYRPSTADWTDLAHWVRQQEEGSEWTRLSSGKAPPAPPRTAPAGGTTSNYSTRRKVKEKAASSTSP